MKRNRVFAAVAVGAISLLGVTACSTSAPKDDKALTFMVFETPALDATFWDASIDNALEGLSGVTVEKIVSPDADRNAYAKQLQASGQFPDILSSINPKDFLDAGLLEPFDQSWLKENFLQPEANNIDGETYIPPTNAQVIPLVFYNKQIFADNNIDVPTTWAEFADVISKLKAAGVTPLELAGAEAWAASMPLVGLASADVLGQDPEWIQKRYDGDVHFTDPLFADAMQKAADLVDAGAYDSAALSVDYATANQNFLDGKSGMYPMGSWFTGSSYLTPEQAANIGAFPWPTDDGTVVIPFNIGGTTSVASQSKDVGNASEFAQNWSLDPRNLSVLIETDGAYPMMKNLTLDDFDVEVSDLYTETYGLVTDENTKVSAFGWINNDDALAPGLNDLFYAMSQSLFSNSDVEAQLAQLDADWDAAVGQ
ncbi:multiple sugar transport system substrate-binding protein/raffinose/stachyose/melibiose transport system substrate-binding protein [Agromyces cerinus]|uniref:ABC transporter substrate-binding protein n=1 Tax=Agromyces cerinus TaxID=33878 RepID=UPI00195BBB3E|nr:extracellular solute-binding protein [Agromyces cerinus]MBM7831265.1 multiple sugar transport system substrate-binding protein/raffinose/stachyose/melibiose transport system substrate-binding protein [Agromyces cerinus]